MTTDAVTTGRKGRKGRNWGVAFGVGAVVAIGSFVGIIGGRISQRAPRAPGHRIAVVDITGAAWGNDAVARLLEGTPGVSVVTPEELHGRMVVLARKGKPAEPKDAARDLELYAIVSGTCLKPDAIPAVVQLEARSPGGDLLASATGPELAAVATTLGEKLGKGPPPPSVPPTHSMDAWDADVAGMAAFNAEHFDAAAASFAKAIEVDPAFSAAWLHAALARTVAQGDPRGDDVRDALAKARAPGGVLTERERLLADGYAAWAAALADPSTALPSKADTPMAGRTVKDGLADDALNAFRKVTVKWPEDRAGHFALGATYNRLFEAHDEALRHLEAARRITPDNFTVAREVADAWVKMGDHKHAAQAMKAFLAIVPDHVEAKAMLTSLQNAASPTSH